MSVPDTSSMSTNITTRAFTEDTSYNTHVAAAAAAQAVMLLLLMVAAQATVPVRCWQQQCQVCGSSSSPTEEWRPDKTGFMEISLVTHHTQCAQG